MNRFITTTAFAAATSFVALNAANAGGFFQSLPIVSNVPIVKDVPILKDVPVLKDIPIIKEVPIIEEVPIVRDLAREVEAATAKLLQEAPKVLPAVDPLGAVAVDALQGKSVSTISDEFVEDQKAALRTLSHLPAITNGIEQGMVGASADIIGQDAADALALGMLPNQVVRHVPGALVDEALNATEGKPVLDAAVAVPLHALIEQAHSALDDKAEPLSDKAKMTLGAGGHFTEAQLNRARWVVDDGGSNIAGVLNKIRTTIGTVTADNHAVTIDDIIVFAKAPNLPVDTYFYAHELYHTVQYQQLGGISGFATEYTKDPKKLEDEANAVADRVYNEIRRWAVVLQPDNS